MDIKTQLKTLLKQAELYRSHGLLDEAHEKYEDAVKLIQKNEQIENRQKLLDAISKKIRAVMNVRHKMKKAPRSPEMSAKVQDLIKNLFSFSKDKDKDTEELEGAIALAEFGQYERALTEFNELIKKDSLRVVAAKNILRCHIALSSLDDAVSQYQQWVSSNIFSSGQMDKVRIFLQDLLDKKGIDRTLPTVKESADIKEEEKPEEEFIDISLIGITLDSGPQKGRLIELDVNFQRRNIISMIISSEDQDLIEAFEVGVRLSDIQFYSPLAVFKGSGIVSAKTLIDSGPKQGDYRLDIKIQSM